MTHAPLVMPSYFDLFSVSMWRGENDLNRLSLDEYFFITEEKKYPFSKIPGYVWTGP